MNPNWPIFEEDGCHWVRKPCRSVLELGNERGESAGNHVLGPLYLTRLTIVVDHKSVYHAQVNE